MSNIGDLFPRLKGELLEISIGDEFEDIIMSDNTKRINSVIYGFLTELIGDFLVVDCCHVDKTGEVQFGNIIYINAWAVKMLTKMKPGGSLHEVMMSSMHTAKMRRILKIE